MKCQNPWFCTVIHAHIAGTHGIHPQVQDTCFLRPRKYCSQPYEIQWRLVLVLSLLENKVKTHFVLLLYKFSSIIINADLAVLHSLLLASFCLRRQWSMRGGSVIYFYNKPINILSDSGMVTLICFVFVLQPQNEHIELFRKRHGYRLDYHEKKWVGLPQWVNSNFSFLDFSLWYTTTSSTCSLIFVILFFRRKKESRQAHEVAQKAKKLRGIKWDLAPFYLIGTW